MQIRRYLRDAAGRAGSTLYEGSIGNFYSPVESLAGSDDEEEEKEGEGAELGGVRAPRRFRRNQARPFSTQVNCVQETYVLDVFPSFSFVGLREV